MRIALVTPAGPGTRNGNRHTALRWAAFLRQAGHRVDVAVQWAPDSRVEIHSIDDDATSMDHVMTTLCDDFRISEVDAFFATQATHLHGSAFVVEAPRAEAEHRIATATSRSKRSGVPLAFQMLRLR